MNEETPRIVNQREQREYLKHLKNSAVAVGTLFIITIAIIGVIDHLIL